MSSRSCWAVDVDAAAAAAAEGSCGPKSSSLEKSSSSLSLALLSCSGGGNVGPIVRCLFSGLGGGLRLLLREVLLVSGAGAGAASAPGGRAGPGEEELSDMLELDGDLERYGRIRTLRLEVLLRAGNGLQDRASSV